MKKVIQKWCSYILIFSLLLATFSVFVSANHESELYDIETGIIRNTYKPTAHADTFVASGTCGEDGDGTNVTWTLDADGTFVVQGNGAIEFYSYTSRPWHRYRLDIKKIIIEKGITAISTYAFSGCKNLESVILSNSINTIYEGAFQDCYSLTSIEIPNSVTVIAHNVFKGCLSLVEVSLSENITAISSGLFWDCRKLKHIVIPAGVKNIGEHAFAFCDQLKVIVFQGNAPTWIRVVPPIYSTLYYNPATSGWTTPIWNEFSCYPCSHNWSTETKIVTNTDDNTQTISIICDCGHVLKRVLVNGQNISIALSSGDSIENVCAALYKGNGKLIETVMGTIDSEGIDLTFCTPTTGLTIKLFFLNEDMIPCSEAMILTDLT